MSPNQSLIRPPHRIDASVVKITSLGGYGQVTRNMFAYEQGDDILLVDCGIGFPTEEMLGVDLLIPDVGYLKDKAHKIKGMLLTHGHEDHIGALPYILPKIPPFPIYGAKLTVALAESKLEEHQVKRSLQVIDSHQPIQIGSFKIDSIRVTHSIPDTYHYSIQTQAGLIYHGADFKFDLTPVDGRQPELGKIAAAGNKGIRLLISDCLGSERNGVTPSEISLYDMFEREISLTKGKFIVTTMSSSISRFQQAIDVSIRRGRQIVLVGRSVEKNINIAMKLGYLKMHPKHLVPTNKLGKIPNHKLTILVAGSQGQVGSGLYRIAENDHSHIHIEPGDRVVFSTDYIPGSETAIHSVIDALYELGATVTYADVKSDLHVSGHGSRYDLKMLLNLTRPQYMYPVGGDYRHMMHYSLLAQDMGYKPNQIIFAEGKTVEIPSKGPVRLGSNAQVKNVMVDGLGVGDVGNIVLRDRQVLAEEGVVIVLLQIDMNKKVLTGSPDIITRGFVYAPTTDDLLDQAKKQVAKVLKQHENRLTDWHQVKQTTAKVLQQFFAQRLQRHPMILPVIIEV